MKNIILLHLHGNTLQLFVSGHSKIGEFLGSDAERAVQVIHSRKNGGGFILLLKLFPHFSLP